MAGFEVTLYGRFWLTPEAAMVYGLIVTRANGIRPWWFEHPNRL